MHISVQRNKAGRSVEDFGAQSTIYWDDIWWGKGIEI